MYQEITRDAEKRMKSAIQSLEDDLAGIRTGRASPALIDKLSIEYYGSPVPLMQLATISVPEPRQLLIRPFDASSIKDIEKSILASDLGLTPINDGKVIRLNIPPLNEQRRVELTKVVGNRCEDARVAIRNVRTDAIKEELKYELQPQFYLVNGDGEVVDVWSGLVTLEEFEFEIRAAIY